MSIARARQLRREMSPAEARMWDYLRTLKPEGFHFRRQAPLGRYYADFACHHAKLVIEIDGDTHFTPTGLRYDRERERFMLAEGYRTVRYTNDEVLQNMEGVVLHLLDIFDKLPPRQGRPTPTNDHHPS